jgi:hypothetical protein
MIYRGHRRARRRRRARGIALLVAALVPAGVAAYGLAGSRHDAERAAREPIAAAVMLIPPPSPVVGPSRLESSPLAETPITPPTAGSERMPPPMIVRGADAPQSRTMLDAVTRPPCAETINGVAIVRGRGCAPVRR